MARSRQQAVQLLEEGRVRVAGMVALKPATQVDGQVSVSVAQTEDAETYVSRGGHKLRGALDVFEPIGLAVSRQRCLDAGASTGGFTEVLLRAGAEDVVAVDVGYGQLAWQIRQDSRVIVLERTNVRSLTPGLVGHPVQLVVADLSFISLSLVLPPLISVIETGGDLLVMVKPQFEVGKELLGAGGVVRDRLLRARAIRKIADRAEHLEWGVRGVTASPLPGPAGNVEYFLWLQEGAPALRGRDLEQALEEGPT